MFLQRTLMPNTILITGATDGIGKQTAKELARMGHRIIIHGRSTSKIEQTTKALQAEFPMTQIAGEVADFAYLREVFEFATRVMQKFPTLNILINNAGVYMKHKTLTADGFETTFEVNHLSPFALTLKLLPLLAKNKPARIINVSSMVHLNAKPDFTNLNAERQFDPYNAYALSKLANVLFTKELSIRLKGKGITVNSLHPGVVGTKLLKAGFAIEGASVEEGAATSVYLATAKEVEGITGEYFAREKPAIASPLANDDEIRLKLWNMSEEMTTVMFPKF